MTFPSYQLGLKGINNTASYNPNHWIYPVRRTDIYGLLQVLGESASAPPGFGHIRRASRIQST